MRLRRLGRPAMHLALAALVAGCSADEATGPRGAEGYYRLVRAFGAVVPGGVPSLERGDLQIRSDGTFGYGIVCGGCADWQTGTWRPEGGGELRFTYAGFDPPRELTATVDGDSITLMVPLQPLPGTTAFVFRRSSSPVPVVRSGLFVLSSVNGRGPPFIVTDVSFGSTRVVQTVPYDSIAFSDEVFFVRHRVDSTMRYVPNDSLVGRDEYRARGVYETVGGRVLLRYFSRITPGPLVTGSVDTLAIEGGDALRRTDTGGGTPEQRYTRAR